MSTEKQGVSPTDFIKSFLDSGLKDYKNEKTLAGELINLRVTSEKVKSGEIRLTAKVIGVVSKEIYAEYDLRFETIIYPYYYLELIKLAIQVYWSGNKMGKKLQKRIVYMNEYGEQNKEYFNRSFKYIYYLKKPLMLFKK